MKDTEKLLDQLREKLKAALGARLKSVILYGSAATGDVHEAFSDLNILCVLDEVTPRELRDVEPVFRWWREKGNPAPLLMSAQEVRASTDCFPIEFHDLAEARKVLYGDDAMEGIEIDDAFYRAQVEHELRAKMLRLRQKAAGVLSDKNLLLRLMEDSVSTFCVLARHALRLAGSEAPRSKRAIVRAARTRFGIECEAFDTVLGLREGTVKPRAVNPTELFEEYLREVTALTDAVDRLER
jgi:predicted nucleotidyltransferase